MNYFISLAYNLHSQLVNLLKTVSKRIPDVLTWKAINIPFIVFVNWLNFFYTSRNITKVGSKFGMSLLWRHLKWRKVKIKKLFYDSITLLHYYFNISKICKRYLDARQKVQNVQLFHLNEGNRIFISSLVKWMASKAHSLLLFRIYLWRQAKEFCKLFLLN